MILIDAQLPARLARHLNDAGHDAIHTLDLPSISTGNITNRDLLALIDRHLHEVDAAFENAKLVQLSTDDLSGGTSPIAASAIRR